MPGIQKQHVNGMLMIAWNGLPQSKIASGGHRIASNHIENPAFIGLEPMKKGVVRRRSHGPDQGAD